MENKENKSELIIYQTEDGQTKLQVKYGRWNRLAYARPDDEKIQNSRIFYQTD